jgi:hypothetical protein
MPLRLWYPLTAAFTFLGICALEYGSLILSTASFIAAVIIGCRGAALHGEP